MNREKINTLGQLKAAGYQPKPIKEEMRDNLIAALKEKEMCLKEFRDMMNQ